MKRTWICRKVHFGSGEVQFISHILLVPTPRTAEDEEQIDLDPDQLTLISQKKKKQRKMPQARGDTLLQLTENRETRIRRASREASLAIAVENGQLFITSDFVMDGNSSTPSCREHSEPRIS